MFGLAGVMASASSPHTLGEWTECGAWVLFLLKNKHVWKKMWPYRSHGASGLSALLENAHTCLIWNFKNWREIQKCQFFSWKICWVFFKVARWEAGTSLIYQVGSRAVCPPLAAGKLAGYQVHWLPAAGVYHELDRIDTFPPQSWFLGNQQEPLKEKCCAGNVWSAAVCHLCYPVDICVATHALWHVHRTRPEPWPQKKVNK